MTAEEIQEMQKKLQPVSMTAFEFLVISIQLLLVHWQVTEAVSWSWGWVMFPTIIFVALFIVGMIAGVMSTVKES